MTDNEIIKALECCSQTHNCQECVLWEMRSAQCISELLSNALSLIKSQMAEIERLNGVSEICGECHKKYAKKTETAKSEAVKEFAERLKEQFKNLEYRAITKRKTVSVDELASQMNWVLHKVSLETIDNLAKEMTEDEGK